MGGPAELRYARVWMGKVDALAAQASADLERAARASENPSEAIPDTALLAIASQLAYGNAIAAANFYMANRLWITPTEEKP